MHNVTWHIPPDTALDSLGPWSRDDEWGAGTGDVLRDMPIGDAQRDAASDVSKGAAQENRWHKDRGFIL